MASGMRLTFPDGSALVAGGSGNVGCGVTRRLAEAGLRVIFTYGGNAERAEALAQRLRGEGLSVWACRMDLGDVESIDAAVDLAQQHGPLRTVASAFGARVPFDNLVDFDIATVERFLNDDAMGCYRLVHRVTPALRANGGGSITICTTMALSRVIGFDGLSPFSKGAVSALVRQIAWEEARHGVRCNETPISIVVPEGRVGEGSDLAARYDPVQRERMTAVIGQIGAMMRLPGPFRPEEVGDLVAFLASDQARHITGQCVGVDGGATL
jgi:NAD(P)-dependent dehydrogenase (short-subunit alcohol dehydrogenase family)